MYFWLIILWQGRFAINPLYSRSNGNMAAISLFALGTYTKAIFYTKTTPAPSLFICNIYCAEYSSSSSSGIVFSTFRRRFLAKANQAPVQEWKKTSKTLINQTSAQFFLLHGEQITFMNRLIWMYLLNVHLLYMKDYWDQLPLGCTCSRLVGCTSINVQILNMWLWWMPGWVLLVRLTMRPRKRC